ncbi:hypothetical protein IGS68_34415 (plasmid) [Skermanella sp. TT6]|uniref:WYL domain-containing protein n=1 Tax=Skermanella cutis TaxID=2775420 RepID=A0ABX7BHE3_9PROT|nr:hypothetical protein [Skermanella sp. TT6]QQP93821.1 hypothetical protein IGS68_34415 [Skermanella sp. TT6]
MTPGGQDGRDVQGPETADWRAGSYNIITAAGRLEVEGIVRSPFGIDERADGEPGSRSWAVTHLPSGLAIVTRIRAWAVALAFTDRIAGLADWTARDIAATPELREQVRIALDRTYDDFQAGRLSADPDNRPKTSAS